MFSMQANVFAVNQTDVMAKMMNVIAVLIVPDIQQKHVEERGKIKFTEQVCNLTLKKFEKKTCLSWLKQAQHLALFCKKIRKLLRIFCCKNIQHHKKIYLTQLKDFLT